MVATRCRFSDVRELKSGLEFLYSMGIVLYYIDAERLSEIVFLRPQWVAHVMKTIIRHDMQTVVYVILIISQE